MPFKYLDINTKQPVVDGIIYVTPDAAAPPAKYPGAFTGVHLPGPSYSLANTSGMTVWWTVDSSKVAAVDFVDSLQNGGAHASNPNDPNAKHTSIHRIGGQAIPTPVTGQIDWKTAPAGDHNIALIAYDDSDQEIWRITRTTKVLP